MAALDNPYSALLTVMRAMTRIESDVMTSSITREAADDVVVIVEARDVILAVE